MIIDSEQTDDNSAISSILLFFSFFSNRKFWKFLTYKNIFTFFFRELILSDNKKRMHIVIIVSSKLFVFFCFSKRIFALFLEFTNLSCFSRSLSFICVCIGSVWSSENSLCCNGKLTVVSVLVAKEEEAFVTLSTILPTNHPKSNLTKNVCVLLGPCLHWIFMNIPTEIRNNKKKVLFKCQLSLFFFDFFIFY